MDVFLAMRDLDARSFHLLSEVAMILLRKNDAPSGLRDYRPICLIHSVGKLFSKVLVMRLAPRMTEIVKDNQTTFIKGRKHYRRQLLCRVSQTLGKGRYTLGKAFVECYTRQRTLGKQFIGKDLFVECTLLGTRQSLCRVLI